METQQPAYEREKLAQQQALDRVGGLQSTASPKPPSLVYISGITGENLDSALKLESKLQSLFENINAGREDAPQDAQNAIGGNGILREIALKCSAVNESHHRSARLIDAISSILFS